jgi:dephospho-CoA kinase
MSDIVIFTRVAILGNGRQEDGVNTLILVNLDVTSQVSHLQKRKKLTLHLFNQSLRLELQRRTHFIVHYLLLLSGHYSCFKLYTPKIIACSPIVPLTNKNMD